MARFGLDSDSDSERESHAGEHTVSPSPSASPSSRSSPSSPSHEDPEDAPPRDSLYDSDNPSSEEPDDEEEDVDGDSSMASDSHSHSVSVNDSMRSAPRSPRVPRHHSRRSSDSAMASTPPPPPPPQSSRPLRLHHPSRLAPAREPHRAAVMQASLFRHDDQDDGDDDGDLQLDPPESERKPAPTLAPVTVPVPAADPAPFRPLRTYVRPPLALSATHTREHNLVDAALALARSFRVGWGPRGQLVTLHGVHPAAPHTSPPSNSIQVDRMRLTAPPDDPEPALRLLRLQLAHTDLFPPSSSSATDAANEPKHAPLAVPSSALRFSHFSELFASSTDKTSSSSSNAPTAEAQLFRLASVLFDEVPDLALSAAGPDDPALSPQQRAYITSLRRRAHLSAWLEDATRPAVEATLRSLPPPPSAAAASSSSSSASGASRIFALLAGHQIPRACDAALASGNLRLATLLSQAGSAYAPPDRTLQADLALQLTKWREYSVDTDPALFDPHYRRVLELLSGQIDGPVLDGLTWIQALAAGLWYAPDPESAPDGAAAVRAAVEAYEQAFLADARIAAPQPAYLLTTATNGGQPLPSPSSREEEDPPRDAAFHLLKLFSSPVHPLETALAPRNFGPAPTDYRLPWHLYMLLSRVLRRRDWEDREQLDDDDEGEEEDDDVVVVGAARGYQREGNSVTADRVTEAYAAQLEALGEWDWAAFVLLHLELEDRRVKAIQNLLARHVDELSDAADPRSRFLTSTLQIPAVWLASARADAALARPRGRFEAYTLLLSAQRAAEAHAIAWAELVPEALLRDDRVLVRRLLAPFHEVDEDCAEEDEHDELAIAPAHSIGRVADWSSTGGVFLSYLDLLDRTAATTATTTTTAPAVGTIAGVLGAAQRLARRARDEPRLRGLVHLRVAADEMVGRVLVLANASASAGPGAATALERAQPSLLPESDRAVWIQGANRAFWAASLAQAVST